MKSIKHVVHHWISHAISFIQFWSDLNAALRFLKQIKLSFPLNKMNITLQTHKLQLQHKDCMYYNLT